MDYGSINEAWGELLPNRIGVVVSVFLLLAGLQNFFFLAEPLLDCVRRAKGITAIQHSVSTARSRNYLAAANLIPFCLIADRFAFYRPSFWECVPPEWSALFTLAVAFSFLLLRWTLYRVLKPRRVNSDLYEGAQSVPGNFLILYVAAILPVFAALYAFRVPDYAIGKVLLYLLGLTYLIGTVRCMQILKLAFFGFRTFLYLCVLEFVPLALLIASAIVF